jgi:hypothetical protein
MGLERTNGGWSIELDGLEDKWRIDSSDYPPCAICGKQIGSEADDEKAEEDETYEPEIAARIWRTQPEQPTLEMAFHMKCLADSGRMRK